LLGFSILSANSWLILWARIEGLLITVTPLLLTPSSSSNERVLLYFLTQALRGILVLFRITIPTSSDFYLATALILKLGLVPLHWWIPKVIRGITYLSIWVLSSVIKLPALVIIRASPGTWVLSIALVSILIGGVGGLMTTSLKKILAWSRVQQTGWLLIATGRDWVWASYIALYSLLLLRVCLLLTGLSFSCFSQVGASSSSTSLMLALGLLSLAGVPPLTGFGLKWLVLTRVSPSFNAILLLFVLALRLRVYFYLQGVLSPLSKLILTPPLNQHNELTLLGVVFIVAGGVMLLRVV